MFRVFAAQPFNMAPVALFLLSSLTFASVGHVLPLSPNRRKPIEGEEGYPH